MKPLTNGWRDPREIAVTAFNCGFCGKHTAANKGIANGDDDVRVAICSFCGRPTFFENRLQYPGRLMGEQVGHLPPEVAPMYEEVRRASTIAAYTLIALGCRKILMHVAVHLGAPENQSFVNYVDYLAANHHVPPSARAWVDRIRQLGNEPNHELVSTSAEDARHLMDFVGMLLKLVYEFPERLKP
jgi:hypothetical protein